MLCLFLAKQKRLWVCRRTSSTSRGKHNPQITVCRYQRTHICFNVRACVCVCQLRGCCCCYDHLPPSPPVYGLINKTASAAPFGSPARVPIILWSNINVWYWACSLIQSQLILSVNYLQILRCGGRSPRTALARFRIPNWLPLFFAPPPHLRAVFLSLLLSFSLQPPPLSSFLFGLSVSFKA